MLTRATVCWRESSGQGTRSVPSPAELIPEGKGSLSQTSEEGEGGRQWQPPQQEVHWKPAGPLLGDAC